MTALSIVLLAMIAAFLGMRLYSVLGKRTGHEQEPLRGRAEDRALVPPLRLSDSDDSPTPLSTATPDSGLVYDASAEAGMRALLAADRQFDAGRFLDGAQAAYRMILEAFWSGDLETLRELTDDDSYDAFVAAIAARKERGETLENKLLRIDAARISHVELLGKLARVTVHYRADIVAITRNADGALLSGSLSDAAEVSERWTFSRTIGSLDPNWVLDETETDA